MSKGGRKEVGQRAGEKGYGGRKGLGQRTSERGRVKGWRMGVGLRAGKVVTVKDAIKGKG
jgi:hypothetical protein